jgi:aminoglycoside phosphotransferase family enzyme
MPTPVPVIPGDDTPDLATKLRFLRTCAGEPVQMIETHMSWLVLGPERVLKLKKPVRLPFLDFSTLALREVNARAELRLNRRLAPQIYLGLLALQWDGHDFSLVPEERLPAPGCTVDWLVLMQRLPEERMLDHMLGTGQAEPAGIDALVAVLVPFYRHAPRIAITAEEYLSRLRRERAIDREVLLNPRFELPGASATLDRMDIALAAHEGEIADRVRAHCIVEGHGDLRPEHVCLLDPPVVIDCLEFNAAMRQVDPFEELVFLGLECEMLGAPWVAERLLERYSEALGERPPATVLHLYVAQRALRRARLALAHLLEPAPRKPEKWLPLARRYVARIETALDAVMAATRNGFS